MRLKPYLRACEAMALDDDAMWLIELGLVAAPEAHPIIKGLRGVRKARIALAGRGKRGGGRVVYYVQAAPSILFLLMPIQKTSTTT